MEPRRRINNDEPPTAAYYSQRRIPAVVPLEKDAKPRILVSVGLCVARPTCSIPVIPILSKMLPPPLKIQHISRVVGKH